MDWRIALLAALALAVLSGTWALIQKWAGRGVGEDYGGPDTTGAAELSGSGQGCSSCRSRCHGRSADG